MKKRVFTSVLLMAISTITQARLSAFDATTAFEKQARGFKVSKLITKTKEGSNQVMSIEAVMGRDNADFKLHINGMLLLPIEGNSERTHPQIIIGAFGLALNPERSLDLFNQLSVDYTPKKIAEGIKMVDLTLSCSAPESCSIVDELGGFDLFLGNRAHGQGHYFRTGIYSHFNYHTIPFTGPVMNSGQLSQAFIEILKEQILEISPDTISYYQISRSSATNSKTYEEHKVLAQLDMQKDFGKSTIERQLLLSLLHNKETIFEEKVKRGSSSGCTYFCGTSGRFVQISVTADTKF